jgi:hypothetical protein
LALLRSDNLGRKVVFDHECWSERTQWLCQHVYSRLRLTQPDGSHFTPDCSKEVPLIFSNDKSIDISITTMAPIPISNMKETNGTTSRILDDLKHIYGERGRGRQRI